MTRLRKNLLEPRSKEDRLGRILGVVLILVSLILGLFVCYAHWMTSELLSIGAESVEATNSEVGALFNSIARTQWRELRFMDEYMRETAADEEERGEIIQAYRQEIGFTYYYLLDDQANYYSARGGSGNFGFGTTRLSYLVGSDESLLDGTLPSGESVILFAVRIDPVVYGDHTYTAMAFAYNEKDLGEVLKVDAYGGNSYPYIMNGKGRAVITSDRTVDERKVNNLFEYLGRVETKGMTAAEIEEAFRGQETATAVVTSKNGSFYLSFQPLGFQDYMLASFTQTESVDGSIDTIRFNTIAMIGVALALVFLLTLFGIGIYYSRNLRRKNALLQSKDAQILSKDEQIQSKDVQLVVQNARLEIQNTQLETALATAQAANQAKTSFLSNVSHDIRTPMNAIVGFASLAEREIDDKDKVRDYLGKIQESSRHLLNLINEVLDFSKIEAGKTTLHTQGMDVEPIIARVVAMLRPQFEEKGQTFTIRADCRTRCIVEVDELRLTQILVNILSNASKYTPQGGKVDFCISDEPAERVVNYTFVIRDNGVGMTEEYIEHLYDPFTREVNSTTNKVLGTGLGLAITKNLVDLMGGTIAVTSRKGAGTTFTIDIGFRLVQMIEAEAVATDAASDEISITGLHILIAEDNELNAELITELLEIEGCTSVVTENGRLCMEEYLRQPQGTYDLILMDVQMPEMNGYEATRAIRAAEEGVAQIARPIPIIAMTANAFAEDKKAALDAGMNAHVAKPVDMGLLKRTIQNVLKYE